MRVFLLTLVVCFASPALADNRFQIGVGFDTTLTSRDNELTFGENPIATFRWQHDLTKHLIFEFEHHSSFVNGWPFNKDMPDRNTSDIFQLLFEF